MTVETLQAFIENGNPALPVILAVKGEDGTLRIVKTDNSTGALPVVNVNTLVPSAFDHITYTSGVLTDTYAYRTGGGGGTLVKTITITYTTAAKSVISTIAAT
jgi:hypothetical protein